MVNDAEANAAEDQKKSEAVDVKNGADGMVYQTEKQLEELGEKVTPEMKEKVDAKLKALKESIAADDVEGMKANQEALQKEMMEVGQAVYSQGGAAGGPPPPGGEAGPGGPGGPPPP